MNRKGVGTEANGGLQSEYEFELESDSSHV